LRISSLAAPGAVTFIGKAASKFHRLTKRERFEPMGACGFRSRGNDRQGRRLGGPKVERGHRGVSEGALGVVGARGDAWPVRAGRGAWAGCALDAPGNARLFIWPRGARAVCAGTKFDAIAAAGFVCIAVTVFFFDAFVTVRAAVFAVFCCFAVPRACTGTRA
jgi:hypothetical protein